MKKQRLITIWGDIVGIVDLIKALLISIILTMGLYNLADKNSPTQQLFFGLLGAIIAFTVNSFFITPKRKLHDHVTPSKEMDHDN
ncbi:MULTISPECIES: hypothetical protein [Vagococcus]|uniref:Uncharacterized protein n=1 Tax=Vagococcus fluvialis bH819 TaxID=1255619 RepID=A0A1X6WK51_9ENTE|nr:MULTISPECIES: hypothetical protein [Vagococcus]SLM84620.1 hypothetical protein FM121_00910 [Vagococcus fluvialis bH819]HCM89916.1 hypothetical protein [Vagococcus sp.]